MVSLAWLCYDWQWLARLGFAMIGNGWLGFDMVGNGWLGLAWLCYCCCGAFVWSAQERIMAYSHGVLDGSRM
jgi:hypothetical protein